MKKLTKILAALLVCFTAFSTVSMAAEEAVTDTQTETTQPDIVLPASPKKITYKNYKDASVEIMWDAVEGADGYNVYLKKNNEWIYQMSVTDTTARFEDFLRCNRYRVGVKSYIIVDGVKYESAEYTEKRVYGFSGLPNMDGELNTMATPEGVKLSWPAYKGLSYYRIYIWKNGKWNKITDIKDTDASEYVYRDVEVGKKYRFAIKPWVKSKHMGKYYGGGLGSFSITYTEDFTKSEIITKDHVAYCLIHKLRWTGVQGADGYELYIYKNSEWQLVDMVNDTVYTVEGLEASTRYKLKVRAYFDADGKRTYGTFSEEYSVTTDQAFIDAYRLEELKEYFTDGDWSVKLSPKKDNKENSYTLTLAVSGKKIYAKYDYKNKKIKDVEYFVSTDKNQVYVIYDDSKTYAVMPDGKAKSFIYEIMNMISAIDMSDVNKVVGKTTIYKDQTAVAEYYRNKEIGIQKKTYYFINEKLSGLKINYTNGKAEAFTSVEITDTPSASLFKIPSGYKKVTY